MSNASPHLRLEIYIDGLNLGGGESLVLDMLPTFIESFDFVEIITLRGSYDLDDRFAALVPVAKVSLVGMLRRLWSGRGISYINLAKSQTLASVVAITRRFWPARHGQRVICHEHTSLDYYTGRKGLKWMIDAFYRPLIRHCVRNALYDYVVSTRARLAELARFGGDLNHVMLLPNSVPAVRMKSLVTCRAIRHPPIENDETTRLFTLSRLHSVKQIEWAIDAVARLATEDFARSFVLEICGRGPEQESLERHASRYAAVANLRIEFPGFVDSLEAKASKADFFLLPSKHEGFPLVLTEAALTGIPAIANDCPHGPGDLAQHFDNVHLASPPCHEVFVRTVKEVVARTSLKSPQRAAVAWPTSEELTTRLIAFMRRDRAVVAQARHRTIIEEDLRGRG